MPRLGVYVPARGPRFLRSLDVSVSLSESEGEKDAEEGGEEFHCLGLMYAVMPLRRITGYH